MLRPVHSTPLAPVLFGQAQRDTLSAGTGSRRYGTRTVRVARLWAPLSAVATASIR